MLIFSGAGIPDCTWVAAQSSELSMCDAKVASRHQKPCPLIDSGNSLITRFPAFVITTQKPRRHGATNTTRHNAATILLRLGSTGKTSAVPLSCRKCWRHCRVLLMTQHKSCREEAEAGLLPQSRLHTKDLRRVCWPHTAPNDAKKRECFSTYSAQTRSVGKVGQQLVGLQPPCYMG